MIFITTFLVCLLYCYGEAESQLFYNRFGKNALEYKRNIVMRKNLFPEKRNGIFSVLGHKTQPHMSSHPNGMMSGKPIYNNMVMINQMQQYPYHRLPRNSGRKIRNPLSAYGPNMYRNGFVFGVNPKFLLPHYIDFFQKPGHLLKVKNQSQFNSQQWVQKSVIPDNNKEGILLNGYSLASSNANVNEISSITLNPLPIDSIDKITTPKSTIKYPNDEWNVMPSKQTAIHSYFTIEDAIIPSEQQKSNNDNATPLATTKLINIDHIITPGIPKFLNFVTSLPQHLSLHEYITEEPQDQMQFYISTISPLLSYTTVSNHIIDNVDLKINDTISVTGIYTEALSTTTNFPISTTPPTPSTRNYSGNLRTHGGRLTKFFSKKSVLLPKATKPTSLEPAHKNSTIKSAAYTSKFQRTTTPNTRDYKSKKKEYVNFAVSGKDLLSTSKTIRTYNKTSVMRKPQSNIKNILKGALSKAPTTTQQQNPGLLKRISTTTITITTSQPRRKILRSGRYRVKSTASSKRKRVKKEFSSSDEQIIETSTISSVKPTSYNGTGNFARTEQTNPIIYTDENEGIQLSSTSESAIMKIDNRNSIKLLSTHDSSKVGLKSRFEKITYSTRGDYNAGVGSSPNTIIPRLPIEVFFKKVKHL